MKRLVKILFLSLTITFLIFSVYYFFSLAFNTSEEDNYIIQEENTEFGFNLDNFKVDRDTIQFGDSFGEIMLRNKLSYSQIYNIVDLIIYFCAIKIVRVSPPEPFFLSHHLITYFSCQ